MTTNFPFRPPTVLPPSTSSFLFAFLSPFPFLLWFCELDVKGGKISIRAGKGRFLSFNYVCRVVLCLGVTGSSGVTRGWNVKGSDQVCGFKSCRDQMCEGELFGA